LGGNGPADRTPIGVYFRFMPLDPGLRLLLLSCRLRADGDPDGEVFGDPLRALFAESEQAIRQARRLQLHAVRIVAEARIHRDRAHQISPRVQ
jgi:hypothetical protein